MADRVRIQMMDNFAIYINDIKLDQLVDKSKKGVALMQLLIVNRGQAVPNYRLMATLWSEEKSSNPENALKTLVSRMRALLNQLSPGLGKSIVSDRGAYLWENQAGMEIDMYEIEDIFARLEQGDLSEEKFEKLNQRLLQIYRGDLLLNAEQNDWALARATTLHNKYMGAVYNYLEYLKAHEDYDHIIAACRKALEVDNFDDRLHMELMTALIRSDRNNEAMIQYKHVMHLYYHYLGIRPSDDMQEFYKQIVNCGRTLEFNLEAIRNELRETNEKRGAFICEYVVFKEIFNLQMRNLERLGSTMFLGVIMISDINNRAMDSLKQDNIMRGLIDVLRDNLRKGDTVSLFSPNIVALLLPMVNYATGHMVMERVKEEFYKRYPNSNVSFNYRIGPLSSEKNEGKAPAKPGNEKAAAPRDADTISNA